MTDAQPAAMPAAEPADRTLAIAAAPAGTRKALAALFALDDTLARIVRGTREPLVGQMRLTWWHDALDRLDAHDAPAEPVLQGVAAHLLPRGVTGAALATMIDGWEELLVADPLDRPALLRHADARGAGLFAAAGRVLDGDSPALADAGRTWALADLARHLSDPTLADAAAAAADEIFARAFSVRWPPAARPIGLLALLAKLDRDSGLPIAKALRVTRFRLFGR
ncbi:MAG: squalene/phytoene synthase family protein [Sphingomonas sp.]